MKEDFFPLKCSICVYSWSARDLYTMLFKGETWKKEKKKGASLQE